MPRLAFNANPTYVPTQTAPRGPVGKIGANRNVARPFYMTRAYLATIAVLTLVATATVSLALWRLMHFAR